MTSPIPQPGANTAAPLPPLPNLPNAPQTGPSNPNSALSSIISGIAPVKNAVDSINMACKQVVQSGSVPGAEQVCAQIVALANSLLPMAAQNALQPVNGSAPNSGISLPTPPGPPQPVGGPPQGQ